MSRTITENVSSNFTIFLKFVIPTFWIIFFGLLLIVVLVSDAVTMSSFSLSTLRIGIVVFYLLGLLILYWAVMRLKRVEMDDAFVYATNYFKTYRYPYHNIEKIEESDYLFFRSIHIYLKEPGKFGKKITFVAHRNRFDNFIKTHPEQFRHLLDEKGK